MNKIFYSIIISLFISIDVLDLDNKDNQNYIQQWQTVLDLQRLIDNKLIKESASLFSNKNKAKIQLLINKSGRSFINAWKLDNLVNKKYKERIFQGKGLFVFEDGKWKIDEI